MPLEEREVCNVHITHRSIYPLILRILTICLIFIVIKILFSAVYGIIVKNIFVDLPEYIIISLEVTFDLIFAISIAYSCLEWLNQIYIISKDGISVQTGLISQKIEDFGPIFRPEIQVDQSILARIFNHGNIHLFGRTGAEILVLHDIPEPDHIKDIIKLFFMQKPGILPAGKNTSGTVSDNSNGGDDED